MKDNISGETLQTMSDIVASVLATAKSFLPAGPSAPAAVTAKAAAAPASKAITPAVCLATPAVARKASAGKRGSGSSFVFIVTVVGVSGALAVHLVGYEEIRKLFKEVRVLRVTSPLHACITRALVARVVQALIGLLTAVKWHPLSLLGSSCPSLRRKPRSSSGSCASRPRGRPASTSSQLSTVRLGRVAAPLAAGSFDRLPFEGFPGRPIHRLAGGPQRAIRAPPPHLLPCPNL